MDTALAEGVPDLRITPHIQKELDNWARNGIYPFPSLGLDHTPSPSLYGPSDLRLVHHISSVAARMQTVESSCTYAIWTRRIPMYETCSNIPSDGELLQLTHCTGFCG